MSLMLQQPRITLNSFYTPERVYYPNPDVVQDEIEENVEILDTLNAKKIRPNAVSLGPVSNATEPISEQRVTQRLLEEQFRTKYLPKPQRDHYKLENEEPLYLNFLPQIKGYEPPNMNDILKAQIQSTQYGLQEKTKLSNLPITSLDTANLKKQISVKPEERIRIEQEVINDVKLRWRGGLQTKADPDTIKGPDGIMLFGYLNQTPVHTYGGEYGYNQHNGYFGAEGTRLNNTLPKQ